VSCAPATVVARVCSSRVPIGTRMLWKGVQRLALACGGLKDTSPPATIDSPGFAKAATASRSAAAFAASTASRGRFVLGRCSK